MQNLLQEYPSQIFTKTQKNPEKIVTTKVDYYEDIDEEICKKIIKIFNLKELLFQVD